MDPSTVKGIILKSYPQTIPTPENFQLVSVTLPPLEHNQARAKLLYLSVDPYYRIRMNPALSSTPDKLNEVLIGSALVQIVESKSEKMKVGSFFITTTKWQEEVIISESQGVVSIPSSDPNLISLLGTAGLTAHVGLFTIGKLSPGETLVLTGAAGSVGIFVGQIAKNLGCHVVGLCGSDEKVALLTSLGFNHVINYKTTSNLQEAIKSTCPKGIDVFFDNVGGPHSDVIFENLNKFGRVVICGQISVYNENLRSSSFTTSSSWVKMIYQCIRVEGFVVSAFEKEFEKARKELKEWYDEGKLKTVLSVEEGLENFPKAFIGLFKGANVGKQLVKVAK